MSKGHNVSMSKGHNVIMSRCQNVKITNKCAKNVKVSKSMQNNKVFKCGHNVKRS
jgi:hypothetical protein